MTDYNSLLKALIGGGYAVQTFEEFITLPKPRAVVLRHDVDRLPERSLVFARLEQELGVKGSYYFRIVPASFNERIIKEISALGHEIGYHYEDVAEISQRTEALGGDGRRSKDEVQSTLLEWARESFEINLTRLRQVTTIKTICMHGSPLSKWDSRLLWTKYDYHDFGIIGEPYFDIDFTQVAYYTDTGRRWDGENVSLRDKVDHGRQDFPKFHSTFDIIRAAKSGTLPNQVMFTLHPQRWHDSWWPWTKELVGQNAKNIIKCGINIWNNRNAERSRSGC